MPLRAANAAIITKFNCTKMPLVREPEADGDQAE